MPDFPMQRLDHPAAWTTGNLGSKDDFAIDIKPVHVAAFEAALTHAKHLVDSHKAVTPNTFPLTGIRDDIRDWRDQVQTGCGIVLLRGLPVDRYRVEDLKVLGLGLASHFGRPVSQSAMGDLVGDVVNVGGKDRRERAYRSSRALGLHTDRCDHIAMLCIRPAMTGGISGYASALTIHNIMLEERPDLLHHLYKGYFHHRFGEQPLGETLITQERIPVFSVTDGVACVIFIRGYIDLAVEEGHVSLSAAEREALDHMDRIANRADVRLDFRLEPGEVAFTNNCHLLHTRTAFEDAEDPAARRHLLRCWMREDDRPMAPGVRLHKGLNGIEMQKGKGTYYRPDSASDAKN